jgi:hypothetical protein
VAPDTMTIRLHLRRLRVLAVVAELAERLVVAVRDTRSVVRCPHCGFRTEPLPGSPADHQSGWAMHPGRILATSVIWKTAPRKSCPGTRDQDRYRFRSECSALLGQVPVRHLAPRALVDRSSSGRTCR